MEQSTDSRILIPRDYSHSVNVTCFDDTYPERLKQYGISEEQFKQTIRILNSLYFSSEETNCTTFMEGCVGCLSLFSLFLCYETNYKKVLRRIDIFLQQENDRIYAPKGLQILNPINNGLLELEIIPLNVSPQIIVSENSK